MDLYKMQVKEGRVFLHDHPAHARPLHIMEFRNMMKEQGVILVEADQCMYKLKPWGTTKGRMVATETPAMVMANSRALGCELMKKCDKRHEHQQLTDGRAAIAAAGLASSAGALCCFCACRCINFSPRILEDMFAGGVGGIWLSFNPP